MKNLLTAATGMLAASIFCMEASAQGVAGSTSNDSASVSVEKQAQVIVNGLDDVTLSTTTTPGVQDSLAFCIGQNYAGDVDIKFTGNTGSGNGTYPFRLDGSSENIFYAVYFDATGTDATSSDTAMAYDTFEVDVTLTTTKTLADADASCTGGDNVSMALEFDSTTFDAASFNDTYTDTLTVTVSAS